jgi:hypothetical protein
VNNVFGAMGLVALGDEATATEELAGEGGGQVGVGADRQMADEVGGGAAGEQNLPGSVEELLGAEEGAGGEPEGAESESSFEPNGRHGGCIS